MPPNLPTDEPAELLRGLFLFVAGGVLMVLGALLLGALIRRRLPHRVKGAPYECGEVPIGQSWVQFDLRFYVVALVFVIFDVEIALFYPWAVSYRQAGLAGLWDMLFFFSVLVVGFLYLWRFGYLDWVRAASGQLRPRQHTTRPDSPGAAPPLSREALSGRR